MAQLEIISPSGEILFYALNIAQGITNIGRHPSNDIILDGPSMVDFHAMLDHRAHPYQLLLLAYDEGASLSAGPLTPNVYCELQNWDSIEIGGFTLLYIDNQGSTATADATTAQQSNRLNTEQVMQYASVTEGVADTKAPLQREISEAEGIQDFAVADAGETAVGHRHLPHTHMGQIGAVPFSAPPARPPTPPTGQGVDLELPNGESASGDASNESHPPATQEVTQETEAVVLNGRGQPIPEKKDDFIIVEISEPEQTVDVEQTANWQLTIINGGPVVATFYVRAEGWVHDEWVTVLPQVVNLNEGERATVQIAITPPKSPYSSAGAHHLAFVVTSPNYPERQSLRSGTLYINPFYEYAIGELTPRQQTLSYFQNAAQLTIPVKNKSNADATFRIDGIDDQAGTTFEFLLPGQDVGLVRQADLTLAPNEEVTVPIQVSPNIRRMVAAGSRSYSLTVSTTLVESEQPPRAMLGQLKSKPLVGPMILTVVGLCIGLLVLVLMRPTIESFGFVPSTVDLVGDAPATITSAESLGGGIPHPDGLKAPKFLGLKIPKLPKLPKQLKPVTKFLESLGLSTPVAEDSEAEGTGTEAGTARAQAGSEVTLHWHTSRSASRLSIGKEVDGNFEPFQPSVVSPTGQVSFVADGNAAYILRAENWVVNLPVLGDILGYDERKLVLVTNPLVPKIAMFEIDSNSIVAGESATLRWNIQDADEYTLEVNGVPETLAEPNGVRTIEPLVDTSFTLIADSQYAIAPVKKPLQIAVSQPTPTPVPTPEIALFGASPGTIIAGESVRLDWNVAGADLVTIDPFGPAPSSEGFREEILTEAKTWVFTLKADKGGSSNSRSVQVQVVAPTSTPTPTPLPQPAVIEVFDVVPNEVVAGSEAVNDIKATWTVLGDYTNIQISSPEFGPVPNLDKNGTIKLPGNKTTVYQLTVYWEDEVVASSAKELTVLEPTPTLVPTDTPLPPTPLPTETPTPTATPLPNIVYFQASGDPDRVVLLAHNVNTKETTYNVDIGTEVSLSWQVDNATSVELSEVGPQPFVQEGFPLVVMEGGTYTLNANSGDEDAQQAFITLRANPPSPPPVVPGVTGQVTSDNTVELRWGYDSDNQDKIIGFRVYRATTDDFDFARVADWAFLNSLMRQWEDVDATQDNQLAPCGYAYYVVAVYEDATQPEGSQIQETAISPETWFTEPCP